VAISVDDLDVSEDLARRHRLKFPLLRDPDMGVITAYGVAMTTQDIAVPATIVVDQSRRIVHRHVGETMADRPAVLTLLEVLSRLKSGR